MIDYRYHALSLAAVIFALALGVLLGVAIGDSNLVSSAKRGVVRNLDAEVDGARAQAVGMQQRLGSEQELVEGLYPLAVHDLLAGHSVGLVFLGSSSDQINSIVRASVARAGGTVATVIAVREPLELSGISHEARGTRYAAVRESSAVLARFGAIVGHELVSGGPLVTHALISRVRAALLSAFDGQLARLQGVVVVRAPTARPSAAQEQASTVFESGMLSGVSAAGVPAVGVELSSTAPSQVPFYRSRGVSSVDDINTLAGQVALAFALAGDRGAFGQKGTAESLLPRPIAGPGQP